ncbi:site-2 protease family protein [Rhabdothermincola sediminis]|uniref:site-2 protease family protein n=1 Tax=Rhabdothermincola sediminis TaxID=2751370 RepID=UPI001AA08917|nr:site-2 protease family protein [Rhabdothermincola sediminis]
MARRPQLTIAGIPVRVEPTFFVIIALLGVNPLDPDLLFIGTWIAIAFVSILVHELGHAAAFRLYGIRPSITLHGFGGLTAGNGVLSPARRIVVSLTGPLSALAMLGLPALWLDLSGVLSSVEARTIVSQVVWINIGWSLLNLLPILPLDGGQVFAAVADLLTGGRGRRVAEVFSVALAAVLGIWALRSGLVVGAVLAAMFAAMNLSSLARARSDELAAQLQDAHRLLLAHRPEDAEEVVQRVLASRPTGDTLAWAAELAAWARLWRGDSAGAELVLRRCAPAAVPSHCYRAAEALAAGRTDEGVALMAWALANEPPGPAKSLAAVAAAGSGQAMAVARELLLIGPPGVQAAGLLRQLLEHAGYRAEALSVGQLLARL